VQDCFVGDIGDFGKYGLLRTLCYPRDGHDGPTLNLGINWYLVPDEVGNTDGQKVDYLLSGGEITNKLRRCDSTLLSSLRDLVGNGRRSVAAVREADLFPDAVYFEEPLDFTNSDSQVRLAMRRRWRQRAVDALLSCDVVFLDPDNGLEVASVGSQDRRGNKYVYYGELGPYLNRGQSLIIYHHLGRNGSAQEQISERFAGLAAHLPNAAGIFALQWHRGTSRVYFVVGADTHHEILLERAERLADDPNWREHFTLWHLVSRPVPGDEEEAPPPEGHTDLESDGTVADADPEEPTTDDIPVSGIPVRSPAIPIREVMTYLQARNWDLTVADDGETLFTTFVDTEGEYDCRFDLFLGATLCFQSTAPLLVQSHRRSQAAEYLARVNWTLIRGNFEMDLESGEVRFRTTIDFKDSLISTEMLATLIYGNVATMNRYYPGLVAVARKGASAQDALITLQGSQEG
jgi:hypothetical protein